MLPPVRLPKYATPVKATHPFHTPHHLCGLDMAWPGRSNPHRESGTRSRAAADGRQDQAGEEVHVRQKSKRGDRLRSSSRKGRLSLPSIRWGPGLCVVPYQVLPTGKEC
jgi:hypothetical protein